MEIIRKNGIDYLLSEKEVNIYFQNKCINHGSGELELGHFEEMQPVFTVDNQIIARRHLDECGVVNLRDLGGVKTSDGRQIVYHHFYRGAMLLPKDDNQKKAIDALGLKMIIDFRSESEIHDRIDYVSEGCKYQRISGLRMLDNPKTQGNFDFEYLVQSGNIYQLKQYMVDMYETMAVDNPAFKTLINCLKEKQTPVYFHCTAGKDRTGVGAALILLCLGVSEAEVYQEYLLSNVYRAKLNEWLLNRTEEKYREDIKPLYEVHEDYLKKTLDEIKRIYGSYDVYFEKEHGLTLEMRKALQDVYCI